MLRGMTPAEVQNLRTAAEKAFQAGRFQQALAHSIRLERAEPDEPRWSRYAALVCQRMGRTLDQLDALDRAAERHQGRGELLKAAAVCKQMLGLDAAHPGARKRLAGLRAERDAHRPRAAQPRVDSSAWSRDEGSGLRGLPLREVVPGVRRGSGVGRAGVHAIPLEDDPEHSISIRLETEEVLPSGVVAPQVVRGTPSAPAVAAEDAAVLAVAEELQALQRTERALTETPLFKDLPQAAFHALIDGAQLVSVPAEQHVFRQGAPGDALYIIAEGEIGVIDEGPPRRGIARLGEGSFFGEMALVSDAARTATCTALVPTELIRIDRELMKATMSEHPELLTQLLRFFRDRSVERVLRTSPLFSSLGPQDQKAVHPYFRFLEVEAGAELIRHGSEPEGLVVILAGRAEAVEADGHRLGLLVPGDVAGEMSLLTGEPARATVRALDKLFALEFPKRALKKILDARPQVRAYVETVIARRGG